jgi:hypothetical protein
MSSPLYAQSGSSNAVSKDRSDRGQRNIICRGGNIPAGWILVDDLRDPNSCGGSNPTVLNSYNVWAIEKYSDRPVGTVIEVCASAPTPPGWVLVDVYRNRDSCGHPAEPFTANVKRIRRAS